MRSATAPRWLLPLLVGVASAQGDAPDAELPAYLAREPTCGKGKPASAGGAAKAAAKVVHHIWWQGAAALPAHFEPLRATWRTHHPKWKHTLWDELAVDKLVNSSAYSWFAPTFHALPSKIQKADAARYVVLHAEGGVYADLDVECFKPFDALLGAKSARASLLLFEEPPSHWAAHDTVVSNGLMGAPKGHPLLLKLLRAVRPTGEIFSSGGSHMIQAVLRACASEPASGGCGCYETKPSDDFFPLHQGMRLPEDFAQPKQHADAARALLADAAAGRWPPQTAYSAQYWTVAWIDPDIGRLWLEALVLARAGEVEKAERPMLAALWSKWGNKYKYRTAPEPPDLTKAEDAYEKAVYYSPTYPFAYYELGNILLELKRAELAEGHLRHAARLAPTSLLSHNNLGVALLQQEKHAEAEAAFRTVLELVPEAFAAVKGHDPNAGAHVNLGVALSQQGRADEAHAHWRVALAAGRSYDYTRRAAQLLEADNATSMPRDALELALGKTLAAAGRARQAALHFATAHQLGEANAELRADVAAQMRALSEVWNHGREADASRAGAPPGGGAAPKAPPNVQVVQVGADGETKTSDLGELTPELLTKLKAGGAQGL